MPSSLDGEKSYFAQRYGLTGLELATLAATPLYALSALRKGQFSIRSLVRYNWTVPLIGGTAGTATAYGITSQESSAATASRTFSLRKDAKQIRQDDMFLVGALVGSLLTPALFLKRAGLINGLLGGAGLGGAGGLITFFAQGDGLEGLLEQGKQMAGSSESIGEKGRSLLGRATDKGVALAEQAGSTGKQYALGAKAKGEEAVKEQQQRA
ncbi:uncharacterized protein FA14DRAFT_36489 [Meira miltonrushii]|uniref:Uncharacterized protein n=1 Tax=Meira miltonrushii TaxID=1280837 RepID=A0A316VBQ2_9BASI|nr:uncharacterized protein FA14DRAFT_36489 [Meira miltonrushii]PWN34992.1 hypothetical protein FA14DRAFT_36489 [Meira miltonrushii]